MITQFDRDNLVKNLPDAYAKTPESNNAKLLSIVQAEIDKLRENNRTLRDSLDLEKAHGKTLDMYGKMVGQERGKAIDDQYRVLIKSRIVRNLCNGDYNSIVRLIALIFGCEPAEILITELDTPCQVRVDELPYDALNQLVIDINTAIKIIQEVMPAGIQLQSVQFTGTFEFGGDTLEYDADAGFGNEAQTIGGYLGYIFSDEIPDLPV